MFHYGFITNDSSLRFIPFHECPVSLKTTGMFTAWKDEEEPSTIPLINLLEANLQAIKPGSVVYSSGSIIDQCMLDHLKRIGIEVEVKTLNFYQVQMQHDEQFLLKYGIYDYHQFVIIKAAEKDLLDGRDVVFLSPYFRLTDTNIITTQGSQQVLKEYSEWAYSFDQHHLCYFELARHFPDQCIPSMLMPMHDAIHRRLDTMNMFSSPLLRMVNVAYLKHQHLTNLFYPHQSTSKESPEVRIWPELVIAPVLPCQPNTHIYKRHAKAYTANQIHIV